MGRRFWTLFIATLVIFASLGFFLGRSNLLNRFEKAQNWQIHVLTEKAFLFPEEFKQTLESRLPVHFEIEVAEDPDAFAEKAPRADLLWARKDWILKTELQLKDFKSDAAMKHLLSRSLSADFFDPEETSSTVLPLLWTLPVLQVKGEKSNVALAKLGTLPGEVQWPFWGLQDFFPEIPNHEGAPGKYDKAHWILFPSSSPDSQQKSLGDLWFPDKKIRPLVICMAFVENDRLPDSVTRHLVEAWLDSSILARLAFQTKMAVTLVQAEELLPPLQRASALRQIGLNHLARP